VAATSSARQVVLELVHGAGHEGVHKTLHQLWADFHLPNDRVRFRTLFGRARCASATTVSIFTLEVFFSRWGFLRRSGLMWPWTSLRLFPR